MSAAVKAANGGGAGGGGALGGAGRTAPIALAMVAGFLIGAVVTGLTGGGAALSAAGGERQALEARFAPLASSLSRLSADMAVVKAQLA